MTAKYCINCGNKIAASASSCPHCGARQAGQIGSKSRITAAILALFLGWAGAHKFYLGKTGMGLVYMIFCWTVIPAIVAFIEGIIYLMQSDEEFETKNSY